MRKILIFNFILVLIGFGCEKVILHNEQASLIKSGWILSYIQDTKSNAIINYPADAARKISIVFTDSLNVIFFHGICNGGKGNYSFSSGDGSIQFTNLFTTQIGCKDVEWEGYTIQNLYNASRFKIDGSNLVIYSKGEYNLYFIKSQN
jgi:heat shock protein HslJ